MPYDNTEIDTSGNAELVEKAKKNSAILEVAKRLKDNVMGTEQQNKAAQERENLAAQKNPQGAEAKFQKAKKSLTFKSGGKVSSASKRADGCAQRGKTKGTMR